MNDKFKNKNPKIVIIADDFTGATDSGVQFSRRNFKTMIITDNDKAAKSLKNCDVLVIDTESRSDNKDTANLKAYCAGLSVEGKNICCFYKKIDSTFRGNIGAEIAGIMDSLSISQTILVAAAPNHGRTTYNGNVYVNDALLENTEVAWDPKTPVKDSYIPTILAKQTDKSIAVIKHEIVLTGERNLKTIIQRHIKNKIQIIVIDALNKEDLALIASVVTKIDKKILFAGSAGFAEFLPEYFKSEKAKVSNLIIAGTTSDITRNQINFAGKHLPVLLINVNIHQLFCGNMTIEKTRIVDRVINASKSGKDIIIRSAPLKESINESFETGQKYGFDKYQTSEKIGDFLGEITAEILEKIKINGILFTGGDTAIKAIRSLNISGTIIQDEILPGVAYGHFAGKRFRKNKVVTKPGAFGNEDAIFKVLEFLNNW